MHNQLQLLPMDDALTMQVFTDRTHIEAFFVRFHAFSTLSLALMTIQKQKVAQERERERERERETDRQTDKQTDRERERGIGGIQKGKGTKE